MEKEVQEFIDMLFEPLPPDEACEFLKLCREELAATLGDANDVRVTPEEISEPEFDNAFAVAATLNRAQRRRLITSLVNYEVLLRKYAKESDDSVSTQK